VLNAFRHQRSNHRHPHPSGPEGRACSTPFGIKDRITYITFPKIYPTFRAQRLSASKIESPAAPPGPERQEAVLNAFRHQRSNHLRAGGAGINPAQVLNAFRHQRSNHARSSINWAVNGRRAQRLSASKIESQSIRLSAAEIEWCSTPFGIKDRITLPSLLLPILFSGAQRLSASKIESPPLHCNRLS